MKSMKRVFMLFVKLLLGEFLFNKIVKTGNEENKSEKGGIYNEYEKNRNDRNTRTKHE